jgi:hypothetical protein
MPYLEEQLGPYMHILLALTFLGVMYLVVVNIVFLSMTNGKSASNLPGGALIRYDKYADGMVNTGASTLGFLQLSDNANLNRGGMSVGGYEPPVFHMAAYDNSEWNDPARRALLNDETDPDFVNFQDVASKVNITNTATSTKAPVFSFKTTEGLTGRLPYGRTSYNEGMDVGAAMMGANVRLHH